MKQQLAEALRMLDTFASAGATHFDLTHTSIDGEKRGFRPGQSLAQLKNSMPKLFPGSAERQNNIIVRPTSEKVHFVQLDDLDGTALSRVPPARVSQRSEAAIRARKWPDYDRCLQSAPPNHGNTGPDTSRADFTWCMTALDWGFEIPETAARLMEVSAKA
jgi:hypothetical protein